MSERYDGNPQVILPTDVPCIESARHLFLTGRKGVGKSTLIRRFLEREGRPVGGFYMLKTDRVFSGRPSVHLLRAGEDCVPSKENFLFFCGEKSTSAISHRFDLLGYRALIDTRDVELLIMDELGPHEEDAERFRSAVMDALNGEIPILGVLQQADGSFLREITEHPRVTVLEITPENRESMFLILRYWRFR